jgi:hypothetical protein
MLARALTHFPELEGATITVGYTRRHLGSAVVISRSGVVVRFIIRLKVRGLSYQTIGHELTHLIQGLTGPDGQPGRPPAGHRAVPSGEKQCDIWTLARHQLFCDEAPTYLRLPRVVRESWEAFARKVRALCIAAIEKRETQRRYIRWLESEVRKLAASPSREPAGLQLELPFLRAHNRRPPGGRSRATGRR